MTASDGVQEEGTKGRKAIALYFLLLVVPLYFPPFLLSMDLPFAYWDWLMTPYYQLNGHAFEWAALPANIRTAFLSDPVQFRPLTEVWVNLQYLVFGGEFWAWYLVKWGVFAATICFVFRAALEMSRERLAAGLAAAVFALNPMPAVLDVISQDLYVVLFGALLCSYYFARSAQPAPNAVSGGGYARLAYLEHFSTKQVLVCLLLAFATACAKEIGVAFLAALLVLNIPAKPADWNRMALTRLLSLVALLAYVTWRMLSVQHPTSHLGQVLGGDIAFLGKRILDAADLALAALAPQSPGKTFRWAMLAIMLAGSGRIVCFDRDSLRPLVFACVGFLIACAVVGTAYPCPKYLPVPAFFYCMLLAMSTASLLRLLRTGMTVVIALLALAFPVLTAPDIYAQWLGMQQSLYEMSELIHLMEEMSEDGYLLTWTGLRTGRELPWEKGATLKEFFEKDSVALYGYEKPIEFRVLAETGLPQDRKFVMLSSVSPEDVQAGKLSSIGISTLRGASRIIVVQRERFGFFETATGALKALESKIGNSHAELIDCQPPRPSRYSVNMPNSMHDFGYFPLHAGPHYLYVFDPSSQHGSSDVPTVTLEPAFRRYGAFGR